MTDFLVTGTARQRNDAPAPTHESVRGQGGWQEVSTETERANLPSWRRAAGMSVWVLTTGKLYTLGNDLTTWTEFAPSPDLSAYATKTYADNAASAAGSAAVGASETYTDNAIAALVTMPAPTEIATAGPVNIARAKWQKFVNRYDGPMQFNFPPVGAPPQLGDVLSIACGKFASSSKLVTLNPNGQSIVGVTGSLVIRQKNVALDFQFTSDGWVRV